MLMSRSDTQNNIVDHRAVRSKRYPLHIHLSFVITLLILITGTSIILLNYHEASKAIELSAEELYSRTERDIVSQVSQAVGPVSSMLALAADTQLPVLKTWAERQKRIPFLAKMLQQSSVLSSIYIGYPNGDFLIIRHLQSDALKTFFHAPPESVYLVQTVDRSGRGEEAAGRNEFLDRNLSVLQTGQQEGALLDPRTRPWYQQAQQNKGITLTDPYPFFATGAIGCTLALRTSEPGVVLGADVTLSVLSELLTAQKATPSSELVMFDRQQHVIAYSTPSPLTRKGPSDDQPVRAVRLDELDSLLMKHLAGSLTGGLQPGRFRFELNAKRWIGTVKIREFPNGSSFYYAILIPHDELLAGPLRTRLLALALAGVILVITVPLGWFIANRISVSLRQLEQEAKAIQQFNFRESVAVHSAIQEIENLAVATESMKATIREFLDVTTALAAEDNFSRLMDHIVDETLQLTNADAGALLLMNDDNTGVLPSKIRWRDAHFQPVMLPAYPVSETNDETPAPSLVHNTMQSARTTHEMVSEAAPSNTARYLKDYFAASSVSSATVLAIPLLNRDKALVGILLLIENEGLAENKDGIQNPDRISFMEALSGFAAVSIETQQLIKAQKDLLESLIRLLAGAIDAKSPYTGGHCQRVPVIAKLLAEAAVASQEGPYRDFQMTEKEWELLHIASWLHDCGKITTPEYVVDKATKLETLYDRIHEIRMRFEVLKRDAGVEYWEKLYHGGDKTTLKKELLARLNELDEEFAFIASCNTGAEYLSPEKIERIKSIAARIWMRTLDDTAGISEEERLRKQRSPRSPLPVPENLLSDKEEHLFARTTRDHIAEDNPWGFKLQEPEFLYNKGEMHNLSVSRGTLTNEERHKINDHIVQTVIMLSELPFPKHLRNVPEVAGGHHEKMDGTGYPRRLSGSEMSPLAKMMAIADIFEALTATDRPYKKGKTLSEALKIMALMTREHHIDPDLFEIFLRSGIYRGYAEQHLDLSQIDDVDISEYLSEKNVG